MIDPRPPLPTMPPGPSVRRHNLRLLSFVTLALVLSSCEDAGNNTGPPVEPPTVGGTWTGSYVLGEQSFAATFTFSQSEFVVSGTAFIDVLLPSSPIEAAIDQAGRVVMLIENDCEDWLGTMEVSADGRTMSGPLQVDRLQCPTGANDIGTLTLTR